MKNSKVGKNKQRNLFAEMTKAGEVLVQDGHLSISHIHRYLACAYTYAPKFFDYLVNIDELYQSVRVNFSRSVFHPVMENKPYCLRISTLSPGYLNPQKAVMPKSILQPAQVR